jgi:hypothetical protein
MRETPCVIWTGAKARGYGVRHHDGKMRLVHRLAYEAVHGPIPEGLVIDHLCKVKACYNVAHLEAVTQRENLLRGDTFQARNAAKTECPQGHPYDAMNTYTDKFGRRSCRECARQRKRERRENRRLVHA